MILDWESAGVNPQQNDYHGEKCYETGAPPDKASLRELLATDGRENLLPLVNAFAPVGKALGQVI